MARRLRVRLLDRPGSWWFVAFGGATIPEDRVIELSEKDAARFLQRRGAARSVEILGWVESDTDADDTDNSRSPE